MSCRVFSRVLPPKLHSWLLVFSGVGNTLGVGVYVLTGVVAREEAGPAVVLSFLIASLASVLTALCYIQVGSSSPEGVSAHRHTYDRFGKLWAFVRGWILVLGYVGGASTTARALSTTFDDMIGRQIEAFCREHMRMNVPGHLPDYLDMFAVSIILLLTVGLLIFGVKQLYLLTALLTVVNVAVLTFFIVFGLLKRNLKNWFLEREEILNNYGYLPPEDVLGDGGFFPFGFLGVLSGVPTCVYAFVGFTYISTTRETGQDVQKTSPAVIMSTLFICAVSYLLLSATLTLMMPYYMLDVNSALPVAFKYVGLDQFNYAIAAGSLCALLSSHLGAMHLLPHLVFEMAADDLLVSSLRLEQRRWLPLVMAGLMSALMASLMNLWDLVELMSLAALCVYTLEAASVIVLRFFPEQFGENQQTTTDHKTCQVPLAPHVAGISLLLNLLLVTLIRRGTWIRFAVWFFLGLLIYISSGRRRRSCEDEETTEQVEESEGL